MPYSVFLNCYFIAMVLAFKPSILTIFSKETLVLLPIFTLLFITLTHWLSFSLSLYLSLSHTQMHTHTLCVSHAPSINGTLAPTHQHTPTHTCTHKDMYALTRTHTHVSIVWYTAVNFVLQHQSQPHDSFFQKGQRKSVLYQKIENSRG